MLSQRDALEYYSRDDVKEALLQLARDREVAGVYASGSFGSRPNVLLYTDDITSMVKSGVVEFHSSIERWSNPMAIRTDNYDSLRSGWDLILDIDCRDFSHAKLAAGLVYRTLEEHGLSAISLKYTGGKGFHLGIPWESIPQEVNFRKTVGLFPDLARHMGMYIREQMRQELEKKLLKLNTPEELAGLAGKELSQIMVKDEDTHKGERVIDPFQIVDIDPVLISPRHLFRMPYSLNKGTGYVSLPISINELEGFEKEHAHPKVVRARKMFLKPGEPNEASALVAETSDWWSIWKKKQRSSPVRQMLPTEKVPEKLFPPCIKNISVGLGDGRKRSVHVLLNFLRSSGWNWQDTERFLEKWNMKNKPPLSDSYIRGQVRWQRMRKKTLPPPNCSHQGYYISYGVCVPDDTCGGKAKTVKNPAVYPQKLIEASPKGKAKDKRITSKTRARRNPFEPPTASR